MLAATLIKDDGQGWSRIVRAGQGQGRIRIFLGGVLSQVLREGEGRGRKVPCRLWTQRKSPS